MKAKFRSALFEHIRGEIMGVNGKQSSVAESMGVKQCDVSMIKRGQVERFSTDKLIDIADKCGWSFSFDMVKGDDSLLVAAVSDGRAALDKVFDAAFGGE